MLEFFNYFYDFYHAGVRFLIETPPFLANNSSLFFLHTTALCLFVFWASHYGKAALTAFITLSWVLANLFVIKQIDLFGLSVVCSDGFIIAENIALLLIFKQYGQKEAYKTIFIAQIFAFFFLLMGLFQLWYIPNAYDTTQPHFIALLGRTPRIILASFIVSLISKLINLQLFRFFSTIFSYRWNVLAKTFALSLSQIADTALFAGLALYGQVHTLTDIILVSSSIKLIAIIIITPLITLLHSLTHGTKEQV